MRILIVGAGSVGLQLSKQLSQDEHDVTQIDLDPRCIRRVQEQLDIIAAVADGTSYRDLGEVGLADMDLVAAMTTRDEVNLLACRMAKRAGVEATVARIRNPEFADAAFPLSPQELGVDFFVHPEREAASAIVRLLRQASATDVVEFSEGKLQLLGVRLEPQSNLLGAPLAELGRQFAHIPMRIVAVKRKQQTLIPGGGDVLLPGDQIFVLSDPDSIPAVVELTGQKAEPVERIMILGGSLIGEFIARSVAPDIKVKLIESSVEKSWQVADRHEDILVIQGDGTDYDLLTVEGITDTDAFIAVTGRDETNIISALIARHFSVPRVIALVNAVDYLPITPAIGLDSVLSKNLLTVNAVQRFVRHKQVASVVSLPGLDVEAVEYIAEEGSQIAHKLLRDVRLPRRAVIGAIVHDNRVVIPSGNTAVAPGDKAVVFAHHYTHREVGRIFAR